MFPLPFYLASFHDSDRKVPNLRALPQDRRQACRRGPLESVRNTTRQGDKRIWILVEGERDDPPHNTGAPEEVDRSRKVSACLAR